jgi:cytochrome o ubiquinol oxidase subunit 2
MKFQFHGMRKADFDQWVQGLPSDKPLDLATYRTLEQPSERVPVTHYSSVDPNLYHRILNRCVAAGAVCLDQLMMTDENANQPAALRDAITARLADINGQLCTTKTFSSKVIANARAN